MLTTLRRGSAEILRTSQSGKEESIYWPEIQVVPLNMSNRRQENLWAGVCLLTRCAPAPFSFLDVGGRSNLSSRELDRLEWLRNESPSH